MKIPLQLHAANSDNGRIFKSWSVYAEQKNAQPRAVATMKSDDMSPELEIELARLFAAAPNMLEAIEFALDRENWHLPNSDGFVHMTQEAFLALSDALTKAKALGKQS